jgi:hypothetical protein
MSRKRSNLKEPSRAGGEYKQSVRILAYDLPPYLEKHDDRRNIPGIQQMQLKSE